MTALRGVNLKVRVAQALLDQRGKQAMAGQLLGQDRIIRGYQHPPLCQDELHPSIAADRLSNIYFDVLGQRVLGESLQVA